MDNIAKQSVSIQEDEVNIDGYSEMSPRSKTSSVMEELRGHMTQHSLDPDQIYNTASKGKRDEPDLSDLKAAFFKYCPNFPKNLIADLMNQLSSKPSREEFLVFFGEGNNIRQNQKRLQESLSTDQKIDRAKWIQRLLTSLKANEISTNQVMIKAD